VLFLEPSLSYCWKRLDFVPDFVVADMAYIHLAVQRRIRERWHVGVVTKLRPDFDLPKSIEAGVLMRCSQGQPLQWMGFNETEQLHWFGVRPPSQCLWCWEQSQRPREFSFAPADHEIVFGTVPLNSAVAQKLLRQARSWIEATQAYDKNRLGLNALYLNSLRFAWIMSLLADTVSLLRACALLRHPPNRRLLTALEPAQINLDLDIDEPEIRNS